MDNNDYRKTEAEVELEREKFEWYKEEYLKERDEAKLKAEKQEAAERKIGIITLIATGIVMLAPLIVYGAYKLIDWIIGLVVDHKMQKGEKPKKRKKGENPTYNEETNAWEYDN